ncbi:MAG: DUF4162 domain-containing protein, partial [Actinomycetota bacterium]
KRQVGGEHLDVHLRHDRDLAAARTILEGVASGVVRVQDATSDLSAPVSHGVDALRQVLRDLETQGIEIIDIGLRRPTLDDVFMKLTGHDAEAGGIEA